MWLGFCPERREYTDVKVMPLRVTTEIGEQALMTLDLSRNRTTGQFERISQLWSSSRHCGTRVSQSRLR